MKQWFCDNKDHPPLFSTTLKLSDILQQDGFARKIGKTKLFPSCQFSLIPPQLTQAQCCRDNCWKYTWQFSWKNGNVLTCLPFPWLFPIGFKQLKGQSTPGNNSLFSIPICVPWGWTWVHYSKYSSAYLLHSENKLWHYLKRR